MIDPIQVLSPRTVESHPEMPVLATLEIALDMTHLALFTWLPEISDPDYDDSDSPDIRAARNVASQIELLRRSTRDYRHILAIFDDPAYPFRECQEPPCDADDLEHPDDPCF